VLDTFFQNPDQQFTRNVPAFSELQKGMVVDLELDLNGGNWCSSAGCSSHDERGIGGTTVTFEKGDVLYLIYDVPRSEEGAKMGVWYGVAATSASYS
jgi:hypothetical protein